MRDGGTKLTFRAPGDDWYAGQADSYLVRVLHGEGPQALGADARGPAGTTEELELPAGTRRGKVQAVDEAGNLGHPAVVKIER